MDTSLLQRMARLQEFLKALKSGQEYQLNEFLRIKDEGIELSVPKLDGGYEIKRHAFPSSFKTVIQNKIDEVEQVIQGIVAGTWPPQ